MSRILVIEDEPAILRGLADNLRFESYEVLTAADGESGYAALQEHKPDLIILLDASPEVLQRRKQEVPLEVTARQRDAYLALVQGMPNGQIVDAGRPLADVVESVSEAVLEQLRKRISRRFRLPA